MRLSAKITRGNETKYDNREYGVYEGYVYVVTYKGVGEPEYVYDGVDNVDEVYKEYKPFKTPSFNKTIILKDYKSVAAFTKEVGEGKEIDSIVGTQYEKYLVVEGENEGGLFIELYDRQAEEDRKQREEEEKNDRQIRNREKCINFVSGVFGLVATCHIPSYIFDNIKKYATYHSGNDDDQEWADDMGYSFATKNDLKGWFFSSDVVNELMKNYRVSYCKEEVIVDLDTTIQKVKAISKKHREEIAQRENKINELKREFRGLYAPDLFADTMTSEEVDSLELQKGNIITIPVIGITGHDIYGGGVYIVEKDNDYYVIKNNGGDGDDWSLNNYQTGGAGAIAYAVRDNDRMQQLIEEARQL